jgi:hypothetical protein
MAGYETVISFQDLPDEEWRSAESMPGYDVSNLGRVRSWRGPGPGAKRDVPRLRRLALDHDGYLQVAFFHLGKVSQRKVHILVLEAFVGSCPYGHESRHLDGVRSNNVPCNLRWSTHAENVGDQVRHGTDSIGERNGNAKLTMVQANEIRISNESQAKIAKKYHVSRSTVGRIKREDCYKPKK